MDMHKKYVPVQQFFFLVSSVHSQTSIHPPRQHTDSGHWPIKSEWIHATRPHALRFTRENFITWFLQYRRQRSAKFKHGLSQHCHRQFNPLVPAATDTVNRTDGCTCKEDKWSHKQNALKNQRRSKTEDLVISLHWIDVAGVFSRGLAMKRPTHYLPPFIFCTLCSGSREATRVRSNSTPSLLQIALGMHHKMVVSKYGVQTLELIWCLTARFVGKRRKD